MRPNDPEDPSAGQGVLGSVRDLLAKLAPFNTAPDGAPRGAVGTDVLYGPGFVVEYRSGDDEIRNAMLTVNDEDCAWPVLQRLCKTYGWKLQDLESGQVFG